MRGSSLGYLIKEGGRNLLQNKMMSMAAIGVLMACLLLIGSFGLLTVNVNAIIGYVEGQNELVVILREDLSLEEAQALGEQIRAVPNVAEVTFVSKDEGLQTWLEDMGTGEQIYDWLSADNPLPHTYTLKVADIADLELTVMELAGLTGVDKVNAATGVAESLQSLRQALWWTGAVITGILVAVSVLIISNTIRLTVFNRRRELNIMKYVGATDGFIRLPFLSEGVLLGLISASLAFLLIWGGYSLVLQLVGAGQQSWMGFLYQNLVPFSQVAAPLYVGFTLGGVGLGAVGSMLFIGKYIKV